MGSTPSTPASYSPRSLFDVVSGSDWATITAEQGTPCKPGNVIRNLRLSRQLNTALDRWTIWRILTDRMANGIADKSAETLTQLVELPQADLIEAITDGLPASLARELAQKLNVTLEDMAGLLRLNPRTLQRRLEEGLLNLTESERLWELSRLFYRAVDVLESEAGAVHWFKNPIQALGWATPLAYARTAVGLRELDNILGRIEHGVYS